MRITQCRTIGRAILRGWDHTTYDRMTARLTEVLTACDLTFPQTALLSAFEAPEFYVMGGCVCFSPLLLLDVRNIAGVVSFLHSRSSTYDCRAHLLAPAPRRINASTSHRQRSRRCRHLCGHHHERHYASPQSDPALDVGLETLQYVPFASEHGFPSRSK